MNGFMTLEYDLQQIVIRNAVLWGSDLESVTQEFDQHPLLVNTFLDTFKRRWLNR